MDGLGYRNWGNNKPKKGGGGNYDDDSFSYEDGGSSGPPTYDSADPYAFSAEMSPQYPKGGAATKDRSMYDYTIDEDDEYDFSTKKKDTKGGRGSAVTTTSTSRDRFSSTSNQNNQRKSTEDRMNEILKRNQADKKQAASAAPIAVDDEEEANTWKSSWDDLLADMKISSPSQPEVEEAAPAVPTRTTGKNALSSSGHGAVGKRGGRATYDDDEDDIDVSLDDDLDISAADLEVGTMAARKAKEKAEERQRVNRQAAADSRARSPTPSDRAKPMKTSESPDVGGIRREPLSSNGPANHHRNQGPGFKMSTTISAIDHLRDSVSTVGGIEGVNANGGMDMALSSTVTHHTNTPNPTCSLNLTLVTISL